MDYELAKRVGNAIRSKRKDRRITMKELGSKVGCSEQAISQYERGQRKINAITLIAIANALNCVPADLVSKEDYNKLRGNGDLAKITFNIGPLLESLQKANLQLAQAENLTSIAEEISETVIEEIPVRSATPPKDNTADLRRFLDSYSILSDEGRRRAFEYMEELAEIPRYQRKDD